MQFKAFFTMATFVVGAVFVMSDIGFDIALLQNYVYQGAVHEECKNKHGLPGYLKYKNEHGADAYLECVEKRGKASAFST